MRVEQFSLNHRAHECPGTILHVALVNNMPDAALRSTELQFARLLKAAAGALDVQLHLYAIGAMERGEAIRARMEGFYADAAALADARPDALIITGAEPAEPQAEPYWTALASLIEWTQDNTISTVFSGLATRAAVLCLDGVGPHVLPQKLCGVFPSERVEENLLFAGLPTVNPLPHSRRTGLPEEALAARGYRLLSRMPYGDPDIFLKPGRSLMLFLQGRPEHDANALAREFLRDTGRFLRGEDDERPAMPENYFDRATEDTLHELAGHAVDPSILPRYAEVVKSAIPLYTWHNATVRLFANWLTLVAVEKTRRVMTCRPAHGRLRA
jgi:homoserine O-succinyltransferase